MGGMEIIVSPHAEFGFVMVCDVRGGGDWVVDVQEKLRCCVFDSFMMIVEQGRTRYWPV